MNKSTITRERLEKIKSWRETYGAGSNVMLPAEEAEELARIALAAIDSEPVAFINGAWTLVYYRPPKESELKIGDKLYRHAQQPVVPDKMSYQDGVLFVLNNDMSSIERGTVAMRAWNACRAAMLQAGNSPVHSGLRPEQNIGSPAQSPIDHGNSPVIPDCWIPVSERMPETDGNYWGWWSESKRQGPVWFIKSELQAQFQSHEITHWMPLPAAPQEVKGE
ncbi:DUF551 domain-containing protein [Klebsiella oxytoca]|uniref:DUF551 domain-containing protein n=1 Tax=Klebsiella oxytoca TaxID=571 RepID=UPI003F808312